MAKIKKIAGEFDYGTAKELTRKQFISIIQDTSYGTIRDAYELATEQRKRKK